MEVEEDACEPHESHTCTRYGYCGRDTHVRRPTFANIRTSARYSPSANGIPSMSTSSNSVRKRLRAEITAGTNVYSRQGAGGQVGKKRRWPHRNFTRTAIVPVLSVPSHPPRPPPPPPRSAPVAAFPPLAPPLRPSVPPSHHLVRCDGSGSPRSAARTLRESSVVVKGKGRGATVGTGVRAACFLSSAHTHTHIHTHTRLRPSLQPTPPSTRPRFPHLHRKAAHHDLHPLLIVCRRCWDSVFELLKLGGGGWAVVSARVRACERAPRSSRPLTLHPYLGAPWY